MNVYGLIGYPLEHSFSPGYFSEKFQKEKIRDCRYELFPLKDVKDLPYLLLQNPDIKGLNVTIPYKRAIIPLLNTIDGIAEQIGAVNTLKIRKKNKDFFIKGYNTDQFGFKKSLGPLLEKHHQKALILGDGGAAKAVQYVLGLKNIAFTTISRSPGPNKIQYEVLTPGMTREHTLIINTTPLGNYPNTGQCPPLNYQFIGPRHLLFDLIYNPSETLFLKKGKAQKAKTKNGLEMLKLQAESSWKIWNEPW